jgi:hypothetical protein
MQEFWFCSACKSMNRGITTRCYRCNAQREQTTLATVAERPAGVVLTPGLDDEHREVASALMSTHRYISAWLLGYVSAALLFLFPVVATLAFVDLVAMVIGYNLLDPKVGTVQFDPAQVQLLLLLWLAANVVGFLAVTVHSVFLALTSMNTRALGSGTPRFGPVRAFFWWTESILWAWWGLQVFFLPLYVAITLGILYNVLNMFGLILGAAVAILLILIMKEALGALGGPLASIGKPKRLPQDLLERLGVPGDSDTRWAGLWGTAWTAARGVEFLFFLGPLLIAAAALLLFLGLLATGANVASASADQAVVYGYLILGVLAAVHGAADLFGIFAMGNITVQLARRQRVREKWVMSGAATARVAGYAAAPTPGSFPAQGFASQQPGPLPGAGFAQPARIAPSPVGAKPISRLPILAELPPDDMTPDWSRPVFSTKTPVEPPPLWTQTPVVPTTPASGVPPAWPRSAQQFAPLPPDDLPPAWRRAVQKSASPAGDPPTEPDTGEEI